MSEERIPSGQLPPGSPPAPEPWPAGGTVFRDALVACPIGYRPLTLDLVVPHANRPVPLVLHIYGGAFATSSNKHSRLGRELRCRLVPAGIAVATPQYRHSKEAVFPAQLHDVKAAVRWLRHHAPHLGIDADRFAAWGSSSGGYLATMLAVTAGDPVLEGELGITAASSAVQAAISWNAPVNFARLPTPPPESPFAAMGQDPHDWLLGAPAAATPDLARAASSSTYPTPHAAPLQLVHGDADPAIPISQSEELTAAYGRVHAPIEFIRVPGGGHVFDDPDRQRLIDIGTDFLQHHWTLPATR